MFNVVRSSLFAVCRLQFVVPCRCSSLRPTPYALRPAGFTLIELLVVIGIIALLLSIGLPSAIKIAANAQASASQMALANIAGACKLYYDDFDDQYPPSTQGGQANLPVGTGAQLLCLLLTGYADDAAPKGTPSGTLDIDDGRDGYGFRTKTRGPVYGPYNGVEKIDTDKASPPSFADAFGNTILYYRFDNTGVGEYHDAHNTDGPTAFNSTYSKNGSAAYYSRNFALCSKGANGQWENPSGGDSDDITNFFD